MRYLSLFIILGITTPALAQEHNMHMPDKQLSSPMTGSMASHENMNMGNMSGLYGNYPSSRESSGTAWVPDSSLMEGIHGQHGDWMTMLHGYANLVYDDQGGPRGDEKTFSESMLMGIAHRPLGNGTLGLRSMFSLDPLLVGKKGYPLLFQTGETADGVTPLIDRQHPHDLLIELAASYSIPIDDQSSVFVYGGMPGEPALGPPTFMHRFSGMINPEAPLDHHWLDSTHITFGVATLGYVWKNWKAEVSAFNGREPDENRWNFDEPRFSSYSGRISYNPTENWALQISNGHLQNPEQLEPNIDQNRTTASATYDLPFNEHHWQTTVAWGRNDKNPGSSTDAFLLESAIRLYDKHTFFARAEHVEKDELFEETNSLAGEIFNVGKLSAGYMYDIPVAKHVSLGLGGLGSAYHVPKGLEATYDNNPLSYMVFARLSLH